MKTKRWKFHVPIYDLDVKVILADNIQPEYKREFKLDLNDLHAACLGYEGRKYVLFFEPKYVKKGIVAHEIFHLTHRILEKCSANFDPCHHECGAYLCEYLTDKIFKMLDL